MRLSWILGLFWVGLIVACSDDVTSVELGDKEVITYLDISVINRTLTKSRVEGSSMPDGAELGVFLRAADGSQYEGVSTGNVRYTANGEGASQVWVSDKNHPIGLSKRLGTAYAYYPWQHRDVVDLKVPITNDGTDWMFGSPVANLSTENNVARFEMSHALCIIRVKILKGDFAGAGSISTVGVNGEHLAPQAVMDLEVAQVTDFVDLNSEITAHEVGTLGVDPVVVELWGIPTGAVGTLSFKVVVDGSVYRASINDLGLEGGYVYQYAITVNSEALAVNAVSVQHWDNQPSGNVASGVSMPWRVAKETDGVYAINEFDDPVPYEQATASQYRGVAFVAKGRAYQVARTDATGSDGSKVVYWWKDNNNTVPGLLNYYTLDGTNRSGYLGDIVSADPNDWLVGSLTDFNGKDNTEVIITAQTVEGVVLENTVAKAVVDFRNNAAVNEGYRDWYLPAEGELAALIVNRDAIQNLLAKVPFAEGLWTNGKSYLSSTQNGGVIWGANHINFANTLYKYSEHNCRLIREIE